MTKKKKVRKKISVNDLKDLKGGKAACDYEAYREYNHESSRGREYKSTENVLYKGKKKSSL